MDKEQRKHETPMAKQDVVDRIHNFYEVALGYTEEQAQLEATRCLQCPNPHCVEGCPVGIDIPAFIKDIKEGENLPLAILVEVAGREIPALLDLGTGISVLNPSASRELRLSPSTSNEPEEILFRR